MSSERASHAPLVIQRRSGWVGLGLRELWQRRELLFFFVWRDLKVRYKQTFFGVAWAVLQPLVLMTVFTVFLGALARIPSDGHPYPLFFLAGLLPWTLFAQGFIGGSNSLVESSNILTKVYFPRLLLPAAAVVSFIFDFLIALIPLFGLSLVYGRLSLVTAIWVIPISALTVVIAFAVATWFAALNVKYRDVRYAVPFLVQLWLFASPIAYPASLVPPEWRGVYAINPLVGAVEGFRWSILGGQAPISELGISTVAALLILAGGVAYFRRVERSFADVV